MQTNKLSVSQAESMARRKGQNWCMARRKDIGQGVNQGAFPVTREQQVRSTGASLWQRDT